MSKFSQPATELDTAQDARSDTAQADLKRRNFLIGAGLGSVGAAAALVAGQSVTTPATEEAKAEPQGKGYRETEHIRRYYSTTRL